MSSFNLQAGQIRGALIAAGLPAQSATTIANILGNAAQTLRHSGEVVQDRTPANLRQVTPDDRKHSLTNLDFRPADPDYRAQRVRDSEDRPTPQPEPTVLDPRTPQQSESSYRVTSGNYTEVAVAGDAAKVNLRLRGTGDAVFADPQSNTLVAKSLRAESNGDGFINFYIENAGNEAVWRLQIENTFGTVDVVTNVEFQSGVGLVITKQPISAWAAGRAYQELIPTCQTRVVTGIGLGDGGLVGSTGSVEGFCIGGGGGGGGGGGDGIFIPTTDCEDL